MFNGNGRMLVLNLIVDDVISDRRIESLTWVSGKRPVVDSSVYIY